MRFGRALAGLFLALSLASCGGRPEGVLAPVATRAPGASEVSMLVATLREPSADPGQFFTGERSHRASFADIAVSIPPASARTVGEVQWPSRIPGNPETDFVVNRADRLTFLDSAKLFRQRVRATPGRRALVFVHGYNTRFEEAVFRFAQIVQDSGVKAEPVLFTWPSRGQILAYNYDRESANYSRDSLERLLSELAQSPDVKEVAILAHSMGNWVTMEALRQMAIRRGRVDPKITQALLAAPDVDVDVFQRQIIELGPKKPAFTLFTNTDDSALALSRRISGGVQRVGAIDPSQEPWRSRLKGDGIQVVNLSDTKSPDRLGHTTFAENTDVVRAIGTRLMAGQALSDGQQGIGAQLAGSASGIVGGAANVIVAAPFAVFDAGARQQFREGLPLGLGEDAPKPEPAAQVAPAQRPECRRAWGPKRQKPLGC